MPTDNASDHTDVRRHLTAVVTTSHNAIDEVQGWEGLIV